MGVSNGATAAAEGTARDRQDGNRDEFADRRDPTQATQPKSRATHRKTDRTRVSARPALVEPIVVAEFWANRRGQSIRVQLREYEGRLIVDIRKHFTDNDGRLQPTKKGLALLVKCLPELATAINKALDRAQELGLLADEARK